MTTTLEELKKKTYELLEQNKANKVKKKSDDFEENWSDISTAKQYETICEVIKKGWHFPTISIANLLKHKARIELENRDFKEAALTLLQSQALSVRHQALHEYTKRFLSDETNEVAEMQHSTMAFYKENKENKHVLDLIKKLPKGWTIVQLSINDSHMTSRFKKTPGDKAIPTNFPIRIVSIESGTENLFVHEIQGVPISDHKMPSFQQELQQIMEIHALLYKKDGEKKKFCETREELENRMKNLTFNIENKWLGYSKVFLLGESENKSEIARQCQMLQEKYFTEDKSFISSGRSKLLHKVMDGFSYLNLRQLQKAVAQLTSEDKNQEELLKEIKKIGKANLWEASPRKPTVLILDKELQGLPWESIDCLAGHSVSRVPSIHQLALLYLTHSSDSQSVPMTGIRQDKIYYVVNPDQDLPKTQAAIEPNLESMNIKDGVAGVQPSGTEVKRALSSMDAFMYCGKMILSASLRKMI